MQTDMTVGKPMKMLLNFTIPVFLGNVFQQLWKVCWNQGAGSGRRYWNHYVPYYWIPDGGYNRSYSSYLSEVRSRKNG